MSAIPQSQVLAFAAASFRSAWTVELLCLLHADPSRCWTAPDLVRQLCASDLVVRQGVASLVAAGLVAPGPADEVRYAAPPPLEPMVDALMQLYRTAPDAVRRAIVRGSSPTLAAFAEAFRLRSED